MMPARPHPKPSDTDPLLRAVATGDPACPDGRALAALGELVRTAATPARADLAAKVRAKLHAGVADRDRRLDQLDDDAIDAHFDGKNTDAGLAAFGTLVRGAVQPPRPVDLVSKVRAKLHRTQRLQAIGLDGDGGRRRLRIWHAVVAGHLAALLVLGVFRLHGDTVVGNGSGAGGSAAAGQGSGKGTINDRINDRTTDPSRPPASDFAAARFASWAEVHENRGDIFLLRRVPELRDQARRSFDTSKTAPLVDAGLRWLLTQQRPDGGFASGEGDDRDLATHSLAVLALLGEGLGDSRRTDAIRRGLKHLADRWGHEIEGARSQAASGLACLALVEGGLILGDATARAEAELAFARLDAGLPVRGEVAHLGGFALLAAESARQGGLRLPDGLILRLRSGLGDLSLGDKSHGDRTGLAAFIAGIDGRRAGGLDPLLNAFVGRPPAVDGNGRIDPLGWFFITLAMRDAGGPRWLAWSGRLQTALAQAFTLDGGNSHASGAHVPGAKVVWGDLDPKAGDVFATSLSLLNLQAAYRYLPLAR